MRIKQASSLILLATLLAAPVSRAQDQSVKPGINDTFADPNVEEFVGRFEVESREVFTRRMEILAACNIQPGQTVADIGAGTGLFTRLFADAVGRDGQVFAVDISRRFLDHIQVTCRDAALLNVETVLCTAESAELPPESVDVAFICDTYHHFEFPLKTMASIHHALRPGGRVVVIDFRRTPGESTDWILNHVRAGQEVFESEIVQSGFLKTREPDGLLKENYIVEFTKSTTPGLQPLQFPLIAGYGGVIALPDAAEPPRAGAKLLLDVTADARPGDVNKGLERAARILNLYGLAGMKSSDIRLVVVLHGEATKSGLNDDFYVPRFGVEQNPNLPLLHALKQAGVEVFVCGQALNYKGFPSASVSGDAQIAAAAVTVIANRLQDGFGIVQVP
jgi:predicted methyltransferase/intracellular sulfur oxidation DsrE/DsrF family protein